MNNQIIEILKSKPHNAHHLDRYMKFIDGCRVKNENLPISYYTETHHILPKSQNWFPEYKDLRKYRWNSVKLTSRQHIVAHIILWKVYGGDQFLPLYYMIINNNNPKKRLDAIKVYEVKSKLLSVLKILHYEYRKGKGIYKDSNGNRFLLHKDDPKIRELGLVGNITGYKFSEESKQTMSFRKKHLKLYFLNFTTSIKIDSEDFVEKLYNYESQGWSIEKTEFDKEYCQNISKINRKKTHIENSNRLKGKMRYTDQNGQFVGWFLKSDPEIIERNLKFQWTENNEKQIKERLKRATEAKLGTKTYNNGIKEVKKKEHPGEGWILGRLPRTAEHYQNQTDALRRSRQGKIVYNDGVKNFYADIDTIPEPHWIKGMKPRAKL